MQLESLPKLSQRRKKRLGRGYGSGKGGHTSSRGQKGQNSRNSVPAWFEGGQLPFIRRLPFIKGKNRFKSLHEEAIVINVGALEKFDSGEVVDAAFLVKAGLIAKNSIGMPIKVLGRGTLTKKLTVKVPTSTQAAEKIKKAGGSVEEIK